MVIVKRLQKIAPHNMLVGRCLLAKIKEYLNNFLIPKSDIAISGKIYSVIMKSSIVILK